MSNMKEPLEKLIHDISFAADELADLLGKVSGSDAILIEQAVTKVADLEYFLRRIKLSQEDN